MISSRDFWADNLETFDILKLIKANDDKKFDLVICLEVAEHINKKYASDFVHKLCNLGDLVLFSAAVPEQGGNGHVNEQRLSYWISHFKKSDFVIKDAIRADIWNDRKIPVWYRNNIVLFVKAGSGVDKLLNNKYIGDIVNPDMYEKKIRIYENQIAELKNNRTIKKLLEEKIWELIQKFRSLYPH